jgi:hypothetical protein
MLGRSQCEVSVKVFDAEEMFHVVHRGNHCGVECSKLAKE